jgi:hypothetical protein
MGSPLVEDYLDSRQEKSGLISGLKAMHLKTV